MNFIEYIYNKYLKRNICVSCCICSKSYFIDKNDINQNGSYYCSVQCAQKSLNS